MSKSINPGLKFAIDTNPKSYERLLIHSLISSLRIFRKVSAQLCHFDPATRQHRQDFSVAKYNLLYACIFQYWSVCSSLDTSQTDYSIPKESLDGFLIDQGNAYDPNSVMRKNYEELLADLKEDFYVDTPPEGQVLDAITGDGFTYWFDLRVTKHMTRLISNEVESKPSTIDVIQKHLDTYKRTITSVDNNRIESCAAVVRAVEVKPELIYIPAFPTLSRQLGGGI